MSKGVPARDDTIIIGQMLSYDDHCFIIERDAPHIDDRELIALSFTKACYTNSPIFRKRGKNE